MGGGGSPSLTTSPSLSTTSITTPPTPPSPTHSSNLPPLFHPPLHTHGRHIHDTTSTRIKLASINWYGGSDELFIPSGLDIRHRASIAALIRTMGFNTVRLPYSDEMVTANPVIPAGLLAANKDLVGLRALDVFEAVARSLGEAGVGVIVNNHITSATWCCGTNLCDSSWHNEFLGPLCRVKQTEEQWIQHWETVMGRFAGEKWVVGCDLRNEPRGLWGTMSWGMWAGAAERCAEKLLRMEGGRDWLMIVEGVSSANDCSGARERPVRLSVPNRLVYSAHVYSWSGWGSMDPFSRRSYVSFIKEMRKNWAFLLEGDVAPVWVGEFGVGGNPEKGDRHYWDHLMRWLEETDADFGYWALNPRKPKDNEFESYSLIEDDWATAIRGDFRLRDMRRLMEVKKS